jgi:hypothetical protein
MTRREFVRRGGTLVPASVLSSAFAPASAPRVRSRHLRRFSKLSTACRWLNRLNIFAGLAGAYIPLSVPLLLETIQDLLRRPDVTLSIAGSGPLLDDIARIQHPRLTYLAQGGAVGHVSSGCRASTVFLFVDALVASTSPECW